MGSNTMIAAAVAAAAGTACAQVTIGPADATPTAAFFAANPGVTVDFVLGGEFNTLNDSSIDLNGATLNFQPGSLFTTNDDLVFNGVINFGPGVTVDNLNTSTSDPAFGTDAVVTSAGIIDPEFELRGNASLVVNGGSVGTDLFVENMSSFTLNNGVTGDIRVEETAVATVNGGTVDGIVSLDNFDSTSTTFSQFFLTGGAVTGRLSVFSETQATVTGGTIGGGLLTGEGGFATIADIVIGDGGAFASDSSFLAIEGGEITGASGASGSATLSIAGGDFDGVFSLEDSAILSLAGSGWQLDGVPIDFFGFDSALVTARGGELLTGTLLDGSFFGFALNGTRVDGEDFASAGSTIILTPTPGATVAIGVAGLVAGRRRR